MATPVEAMAHGQIDISKRLFSFTESMVLKCAVELRIADIIHSHGHPITLSHIVSSIDPHSPSLNVGYLQRIMRYLVRMKVFSITTIQSADGNEEEETLYGLTPSSVALLHDAEISLSPFLLMENHPLLLSTWHYLSDCVRESKSGFKKAHGCELFEMASISPDLNKIFNDAMRCSAKLFATAILSVFRYGFNGVESLVDVGGGMGHLVAEIVKEVPHVKGINFDLPHVVAAAPEDANGVSHVAGDMFNEIPAADAVLMKSVMHDWGDEDCIKILKNCRKALKRKTGKVIIVDVVLSEDTEPDGQFGNLDVILDLLMMAHCLDGKERTTLEWKKILEKGGFPQYKIIKLPYVAASLIEAYPG